MAEFQRVNIGTYPNDKTGDKNRDAWIKANANFEDVYNRALFKDTSGGYRITEPPSRSDHAVNSQYVSDAILAATDDMGSALAAEAVLRETGDAGAITTAHTYTDTQVAAEATARSTGDTATLSGAKDYTDTQVSAEASARGAGDTATLNSAKAYTDTQVSAEATARSTGDTATLNSAKAYTDANANASTRVSKAGDTMTGPLLLSAAPTVALGAATKDYVDTADALLAPKANPTFTGTVTVPAPAADGHAARRRDVGMELIAQADLTGANTVEVTIPDGFTDLRFTLSGIDVLAAGPQQVWMQVKRNGAWVTGSAKYYQARTFTTENAGLVSQAFADAGGAFFIGYCGYSSGAAGGSIEGSLLGIESRAVARHLGVFTRCIANSGGSWGWVGYQADGVIANHPAGQRIEAIRFYNVAAPVQNWSTGYLTISGTRKLS